MKHTALPPGHVGIKGAGEATGLSANLLRIWELRYGWPRPRRQANGYRCYDPGLVADLRRVAERHRAGVPIGELIRDGAPVLPRPETATFDPRCSHLRTLVAGHRGGFARVLLRAIETRNPGPLRELLQRAGWELRPADELAEVLVPIVVGCHEARARGRAVPGAEGLFAEVAARCRQLVSRFVPGFDAGRDDALAWAAAAVLALRHGADDPAPPAGLRALPADGADDLAALLERRPAQLAA